MKKTFLLLLLLGGATFAMAQQPTIGGQTKVTYTTSSAPAKSDQSQRIKVTPGLQLLPGQDNVVKFSVDKVADKQLIVKVVTEETCAGRKGEVFGEYVLTPKVEEGKVVVRVGAMDVLGAYQNIGNVELTIGVAPAEEDKQ